MGIVRSFRLFLKYAGVNLKSAAAHKASFFLMLAGRFILLFSEYLSVRFLFERFPAIGGYSSGEIILCFSCIHASFAVADFFGHGLNSFSAYIRRGELDRVLVRPADPLFQVIGGTLGVSRMGLLIAAAVTVAIGIRACPVSWCAGRVVTLLLMIVGGTLLFFTMFLLGACICFFSIENSTVINILTYGAETHGKYPFDIYGKSILYICTFLVPYAFVQYYPLQYLLGRTDSFLYGLLPLGTVPFFLLALLLWRYGLRRYASSGS